jgi:hypothetical protein
VEIMGLSAFNRMRRLQAEKNKAEVVVEPVEDKIENKSTEKVDDK